MDIGFIETLADMLFITLFSWNLMAIACKMYELGIELSLQIKGNFAELRIAKVGIFTALTNSFLMFSFLQEKNVIFSLLPQYMTLASVSKR